MRSVKSIGLGAEWSWPLPKPLKIPTVVTLTTPADVRQLIESDLPTACRERETWKHVADRLHHVARDGDSQRRADRVAVCVTARAGALPAEVRLPLIEGGR